MAPDGSVIIDTKIDDSGLKGGLEGAKNVAEGTAKAIGAAIAAISVALVAAGKSAIDIGSNFESAMSNLEAITGMSHSEMAQMEEGIRGIATATGMSVQEIAVNSKMVAEAGGDVDLALAQLTHGTNLAIATETDMATTLDFLGSAMKTFGLEGKNAAETTQLTQHAVDSLATVTTMANLTISQLAESYVNVGGSASQAGLSMDQVNAFLVTFSNAGLKGGAAGTALNGVLRNLSAPTDKASVALKDLGVELYDNEGKSRDVTVVMKELEEKLGGLSDEERANAESVIFDSVALKAWRMITDEGVDSIMELSTELENSSDAFDGLGQAAGMMQILTNNFKGDVNKLKAAAKDLGISVYQHMLPALREGAQMLTGFINDAHNAFKEGGFEAMVESLGQSFGKVVLKITEQAPKVVEAATLILKTFVHTVTQNIPLIIDAAVSVGTTLVRGFMEILPDIIDAGIQMLTGFISGFSSMIPDLVHLGVKAATTLITGVIQAIPQLLSEIPNILGGIVEGLFSGDTAGEKAVGIITAIGLVVAAVATIAPAIVGATTALAAAGPAISAFIALLTGPVGIAVAIGVVVAALVSWGIMRLRNEALEHDAQMTAKAFGDIKLSAEEAERAASTSYGPTIDISQVTAAKSRLEELSQTAQSLSASITEKLYLVQVGVKLSEAEQKTLSQQVDDLIATGKAAIETKRELVEKTVNVIWGSGDNDQTAYDSDIAAYFASGAFEYKPGGKDPTVDQSVDVDAKLGQTDASDVKDNVQTAIQGQITETINADQKTDVAAKLNETDVTDIESRFEQFVNTKIAANSAKADKKTDVNAKLGETDISDVENNFPTAAQTKLTSITVKPGEVKADTKYIMKDTVDVSDVNLRFTALSQAQIDTLAFQAAHANVPLKFDVSEVTAADGTKMKSYVLTNSQAELERIIGTQNRLLAKYGTDVDSNGVFDFTKMTASIKQHYTTFNLNNEVGTLNALALEAGVELQWKVFTGATGKTIEGGIIEQFELVNAQAVVDKLKKKQADIEVELKAKAAQSIDSTGINKAVFDFDANKAASDAAAGKTATFDIELTAEVKPSLANGAFNATQFMAAYDQASKQIEAALEGKGKQLREAFDNAIADGVISGNEAAVIQKLQLEYTKMATEISSMEMEIELRKIKLNANNTTLSKESFQDLNKRIEDLYAQDVSNLEISRDIMVDQIIELSVKLGWSEAETQAQIDAMNQDIDARIAEKTEKKDQALYLTLAPTVAEASYQILGDALGNWETAIENQIYDLGERLGLVKPGITLEGLASDILSALDTVEGQTELAMQGLPDGVRLTMDGLSGELQAQFTKITGITTQELENYARVFEDKRPALEAQIQAYTDMGMKPPQALVDELTNGNMISALTSGFDNIDATLQAEILKLAATGDLNAQTMAEVMSRGAAGVAQDTSLLTEFTNKFGELAPALEATKPGIMAQLQEWGFDVSEGGAEAGKIIPDSLISAIVLGLSTGEIDVTQAAAALANVLSGSTGMYDNYLEEVTSLGDSMSEATDGVGETLSTMAGYFKEHAEEVDKATQELANQMRASYEALAKVTTDGLSKIDVDAKTTIASVLANLNANQATVSQWITDMEVLKGKTDNIDFLEWLRKMGPEQAGLIHQLATDTGTGMKDVETAFTNGTKVAMDGMKSEFDVGEENATRAAEAIINKVVLGMSETPEIDTAASDMIKRAVESMSSATTTAQFEDTGKNIDAGVATGVQSGTQEVENATKNLGDAALKSLNDSLGVASPSTKTKESGGYVTEGLAEGIKGKQSDVEAAVKALSEAALNGMKNVMTAQAGTEIGQQFAQAITAALTAEQSATTTAIQTSAQAAVDAATNVFTASAGQTIGETFIKAITTAITAEQGLITSAAQTLAQGIIDAINNVLTPAMGTQTGQQYAQAIANAVQGEIGTAQNAAMTLAQGAVNAAANTMSYSAGQQIGNQFGQGIASGIQNMSGSVMSTAQSLAQQAANAVKNALQIHSPSKLMEYYGEMFGEGFVEGIDATSADAETQAAQMAEDARKAIGDEIDNISSQMKMVIDFDVTDMVRQAQQALDMEELHIAGIADMKVNGSAYGMGADGGMGGGVTYSIGEIHIHADSVDPNMNYREFAKRMAEETEKQARYHGVFTV